MGKRLQANVFGLLLDHPEDLAQNEADMRNGHKVVVLIGAIARSHRVAGPLLHSAEIDTFEHG